ncbi:MAG: hypothetical protein V4443_00870 [Pseudomonadota bacterium]
MKNVMLVMFIAVLAACSSTTGQQSSSMAIKQDAAKWVGRSADDLVVAKGVPTNTYLLDGGGREFEYFQVYKTLIVKSRVPLNTDLRVDAVNQQRGLSEIYSREKSKVPSCVLIFEIGADNLVKKWSLEGDKCT